MPGWNECSIYDAECRARTCSHPTNPKNQGVQCRTMLSQRPCGSSQCTREECSRARVSASVLATIPDTENGSTGSVSAPQTERDTEPTYTLTGLTRRHVDALRSILARTTAQTSAEVEARVIIGATLDKITAL